MKKLILLLLLSTPLYAQPVLNFSDIVYGPKTGNSDTSLGQTANQHGAIVTVWGHNLGSSQGSSKIYCNGVEAPYVYSWSSATAISNSGNGPADLWTYHRMQMIEFQVSSAAAYGAGTIYVTVDSTNSNTLAFNVSSGSIYFVGPDGNDSTGNGSFSAPWATLDKAANGSTVDPGDIIYGLDGLIEEGPRGFIINGPNGISTAPISVIGYPGATVLCQQDGIYSAISNWNNNYGYWNFSKLVASTTATGITLFTGSRIVGCEVTGKLAVGQSGAISGSGAKAGGILCYGDYIHDFGPYDGTGKLHHVFYISNRSGSILPTFELGWNYVTDCGANRGLHVYDEGVCGDWSGTMKIHDNVVVNQHASGIDIVSGAGAATAFSMPVHVYNNLFINVGIGPDFDGPVAAVDSVLYMGGANNKSDVLFYNNTCVGWSFAGGTFDAGLVVNSDFGGTWEWRNNIMYNIGDVPFADSVFNDEPSAASNNIYYTAGSELPPSWDALPTVTEPTFVSTTTYNYGLDSASTGAAGGYDTTSIVAYGLNGTARSGSYVDIGAYQSSLVEQSSVPAIPTNLVATTVSSTTISVTWTDNSDNEEGFYLERDTLVISTETANSTSYTDTSCLPATTYSYRIRAYNGAYLSAYSNSDSATTNNNPSVISNLYLKRIK